MKTVTGNKMGSKAKQVAACALAGVMAMGLAVAPAYAAPITSVTDNNTSSQDVTLTFKQNESINKVYSIDVTWGDLDGTYTNSQTDTWDPAKHEYTGTAEGTYSDFGETSVTVKNHSNAAVTVTPSYQAKGGFETIKGQFDQTNKVLATAVGTAVEAAPTATFKLTLSGDAANLFSKVEQKQTVGTATVTITEAQ